MPCYPTHPSRDVDAPDCTTKDANNNEICHPPYYPQLDLENLQAEENTPETQDYFIDLMNGNTTKRAYQTVYWQSRREDPRVNRYYAGYFLSLTGLDGFIPYTYYQLDADHHPYNDFIGNSTRQHMTAYPSPGWAYCNDSVGSNA